MGNFVSCYPTSFPSPSRLVRVLNTDGRIGEHGCPIRAAELMLENPNHFVCDYSRLCVGARVNAVCADEELESRDLYFLLPMEMLYTVLSQPDMESLAVKASLATRSVSSKSLGRIFPMLGELCMFPSQIVAMEKDGRNVPEPVKCLSRQRSSFQWRPALDTIVETPPRTNDKLTLFSANACYSCNYAT